MPKRFFQNPASTNKALLISAIILAISVIFFLYQDYKSKSDGISWFSGDDKEIPSISVDQKIFDFGLNIEKISVLAPVVANVDGTNKTAYNKALLSGVAHYKNTALPGEGSNIFIFGHSSTWNGVGDWAEAFSRLNDLVEGDNLILYYKNKEFVYRVYKKSIVAPDDLSSLEPTKTEQLTLMTCWPIGSNLKRLIVTAKLVQ